MDLEKALKILDTWLEVENVKVANYAMQRSIYILSAAGLTDLAREIRTNIQDVHAPLNTPELASALNFLINEVRAKADDR